MTRVRWIVLFAVVLCAAELDAAVWSAGLARSSSAIQGAPAAAVQSPPEPAPAVDLSRERELLDEAKASLTSFDYATARAKATEAVCALLGRPEADRDATWLVLLDRAGHVAADTQDPTTANSAWQQVLEVRSRTLPGDHPDLQAARQNLAITHRATRATSRARGPCSSRCSRSARARFPTTTPTCRRRGRTSPSRSYALGRSRGRAGAVRAGPRGPLAHAARRPPRPPAGAGEPRRHDQGARRPGGRAGARRSRCSRSARARCPTTTPTSRWRG